MTNPAVPPTHSYDKYIIPVHKFKA